VNKDGSISVVPDKMAKPIRDMSETERSLVLGEFANVCYNDDITVAAAKAKELGFKRVEFYVYGNAEAYRFTSDDDTVIACRGTETSELSDMITDLKIARIPCKDDDKDCIPGVVHAGWRNLKKIGNRNFEHFGALRASARRKRGLNYMSIEIRTPNFVPVCFLFFL